MASLFPCERPAPSVARLARSARRIMQRDLIYGYALYGYGVRRHRALTADAARSQTHVYTAFYRLPTQFDALLGPVLDQVGVEGDGHRDGPLQISVLAGSIGAEAYTLAAVLMAAVPECDFEIECSDLHDETVARAREGRYAAAEVLAQRLPDGLVTALFDRDGEQFVVKDTVRSRVRFFTADIVNADLAALHQASDLVFVQNVFCHLDDVMTAKALDNVLHIAKPNSVIFLDGMSLESRERLTLQHALEPLEFKTRRIHREVRQHLPAAWWTKYYGVEPFLPRRGHRRRYATVFMR
jgi:chemotaxis methyl-accepting protein methylase